MIAPLRLMLPLHWRWRWLSPGERSAQLALDAMANLTRYGSLSEDPAPRDPHADDAIHRYLVGPCLRQLEIGAGVGTYTTTPYNPPLASVKRAYYANEPVEALWTALHARFPTVERVGGDAYNLAAPSCTFDVVTVLHTLHHLADRARAFAEWRRVLVPGGHLLIVEPRHTWRRAVRLGYVWATEYCKTDNPLRYATHDFCTRAELRSLCASAGLIVREMPRVRGRVVVLAEKRG